MSKTIGDRVVNFYREYIATTKSEPKSKKETKLLSVDEYDPLLMKEGYVKLTPEKRRKLSQQCPILMKGIKKKNMDTFRAWFTVETVEDRGKPIDADLKVLRNFEKRSNYKAKLNEAGICSDVYGDGFLLITFTRDEKRKLHDPVDKRSEPYNITVLNSEYITKMKYYNNAYKEAGILHYYYYDSTSQKEMYIHPDRVQHVPADKLPFSKFGLSKMDLLRHIIISKKNVDIATGEILAWFSHGILDFKWDDMQPEEKKEMIKIAAQHPGAYVHDEDMEMKVHNPTAIDPKPFYDYIILNIAAALNMPTHILTGIQVGRVQGSEVGFADYYRDVHDTQDLLYRPLIEDLYKRIIEARGRVWKYELIWNPIYIDETTEGKLLIDRVTAAEKALNGTKGIGGFIDKKEAREMINKGMIELDPNKEIKDKVIPPFPREPKPNNPAPPSRPGVAKRKVNTSLLESVVKNIKVKVLSKEEEAMITRCKEAERERIKREKKLGKQILKEQEEKDNATSGN